MDNLLKLSKKSALQRLNHVAKTLFTSNDIGYELDPTVSVLFAVTYADENDFATNVLIGTDKIHNAKRTIFHSFVSDVDFARVVLNMHHEYMHHIQKNQVFCKKDLNYHERRQLIQEIACFDNPDYYINDGNYVKNANEIQAEYFGINKAYKYLCKEFPNISPKYIENLFVEIVNDKIQNSTYFIKETEHPKSLDEINILFEKAYDASFSEKRTYFVGHTNTKDVVKTYMRSHPDTKDTYLSLDTAYEQDKYISYINLQLHPDLEKAHPFFQNDDWYQKEDQNMSVSEGKYTPVTMLENERKRKGILRGQSLGAVYASRKAYLEKAYDPYTSYIDDYRDEKRADAKNAALKKEHWQMTDMMNDLLIQESDRYVMMYPLVYHCSEAKALKSLEAIGIKGNTFDAGVSIEDFDVLMARNQSMYKSLSARIPSNDFLDDIGCNIYDELDRANGMFDPDHAGILPSSRLYHDDVNRQHLILDKYDSEIRRLASTYGYNGYRAYLLDKFRETSDIMHSENRTVPTDDEVRSLTIDEYGEIYYDKEDAKFMHEYDSGLFDSAMTEKTKSNLSADRTRGFEFDTVINSHGASHDTEQYD